MNGNDIRLEVYVSVELWKALQARAKEEDRSMSAHVRRLIRSDLASSIAQEREQNRRNTGGTEGEDA